MFKKILVSVDLSDIATVALEYAANLAQTYNSSVKVLHVDAPAFSYIGNEIGPPIILTGPETDLSHTNSDLEAMADFLKQKGIQVECELRKGPVIETIVDVAAEYAADLIIMGAHNHGFLYHAFIGSVSTGVLKHTACPVMVIPKS